MDRIEEKKKTSTKAAKELEDFLHTWKNKYDDEGLICEILYSYFIMDPENDFEVYDAMYEYTSTDGAEIAIEEILKDIDETKKEEESTSQTDEE